MKLCFKRISLLLALAALAAALTLPSAAVQPERTGTVLFTHDMHSHFLPQQDGQGGSYGGFARLKTLIDRQKALDPNAILVDAGDFSMGTLFQTAYATSALELRLMGALGYDAVTLGNHEFDYRASGLAAMLRAAASSGEPLPALVEANYLPPAAGQEGYDQTAQEVWDAFSAYGVSDYVLLERGGLCYAVFGVMGKDSDECAPMSGMVLQDQIAAAQRVVDEATAACLAQYGVSPVVVCLSHSGTDGKGRGEDYELAKKVKGIHLIVSGHSHSTLEQPVRVGDTYLVSCGEYTKNLGVAALSQGADGKVTLTDYRLVPVDAGLSEDAAVARRIETAKKEVERDYLAQFALTFDQVLADNPYRFDTVEQVYAAQHESTLGNLLADAYAWAAREADGQPVDVALTASGVIRESLPQGAVTVSDVFSAASLGIGADGRPGYPLVAVYLTGKDLKTVMEIDASVSPLMGAAQLYCSGIQYGFNTNRMIFNKVTEGWLRREDGLLEAIDNAGLYRVVTGLYCGQMLGAVEDSSFGLLSVTARDASGAPIDMARLEDYILRDESGGEVKEWYAVAAYLQAMGGEIDGRYGQTDGRKNVYASWNPVELLKSPNRFTLIALAAAALVIAGAVLAVRKLSRRGRGKKGRNARGYSPYRGK